MTKFHFCLFCVLLLALRAASEFRYCSKQPCQNGGTCIDVENNYKCFCRPEYLGTNCDEFNNCFPNPCLNGATCVHGDYGYWCICTPEFEGYNCTKTCPTGWTTFDGSCYRVNTSPVNWLTAQSLCRKDGGDIVEITSVAQNAFLGKLKNESHVKRAWIGLNNHGNGTLICASSGKIATFTKWSDASNVKGCVEMCTLGDWKYLDCGSNRPYFCKRPLVVPCPAGLLFSQRSCYSISTSITNWFLAQTSCRKDGGNLVEINSAAENAYLVDLMDVSSVPYAWIGLKVDDNEDTNFWASSGKVNYTNWADSSSYISEDCVVMMAGSGRWKKMFCGSPVNYICEYSNKSSHCFPDPCLNGGICTGVKGNYTCSCRPGFFGRNCQEFNLCSSNPCQNGGTCVDGDNYYICNCADGFTGGNCIGTCPAGWTPFETGCYNFTASPLDWTEAEASCKHRGGHLAEITSTAVNDFLVRLRDKADGQKAWIGLRKKENENTYIWFSSRKGAKFTNWARHQPSDTKGCVEMWWSGMWNDLKCGSNRSYFCERSVIVSYFH